MTTAQERSQLITSSFLTDSRIEFRKQDSQHSARMCCSLSQGHAKARTALCLHCHKAKYQPVDRLQLTGPFRPSPSPYPMFRRLFLWRRHVQFRVSPRFETKDLQEIFRHKVFKMLLSKGKITEDLVNMLMSWRHSGFIVFCGPRFYPCDEEAMENLARHIIRASFSQERMTYIPEVSKVNYCHVTLVMSYEV